MTKASLLQWNTERSRVCFRAALIMAGLALFNGCARNEPETVTKEGKTLTRIILQSDWFAQPEHGGFYQALANGYYEDAGLEVEIRQGGPNAMPAAKLTAGQVHFAIGRSYEGILRAARGVPPNSSGRWRIIAVQEPEGTTIASAGDSAKTSTNWLATRRASSRKPELNPG